jgi:serine phosphatase RsbU (regulator of sigma subunit)
LIERIIYGVLLLYTEGVTEAKDNNSKLFFEEKLASILNENRGKKPADIIKAFIDAL